MLETDGYLDSLWKWEVVLSLFVADQLLMCQWFTNVVNCLPGAEK